MRYRLGAFSLRHWVLFVLAAAAVVAAADASGMSEFQHIVWQIRKSRVARHSSCSLSPKKSIARATRKTPSSNCKICKMSRCWASGGQLVKIGDFDGIWIRVIISKVHFRVNFWKEEIVISGWHPIDSQWFRIFAPNRLLGTSVIFDVFGKPRAISSRWLAEKSIWHVRRC